MTLDPMDVKLSVKAWLDRFGLGDQWTFDVLVVDSAEEGDQDCKAFVETEPEIPHANFTFNSWQIEDVHVLESVVCHEVLHVVFWQELRAMCNIMRKGSKGIGRALHEQNIDRVSRALVALSLKEGDR